MTTTTSKHLKGDDDDDQNFEWADIAPSRSIEWHPCFGRDLDCARLDVPMDWQDPTEDLRVVLAIIRLRAATATNTSDYRGPVFFNPGGPGGSGIWSLRDHGKHLQTIVGPNHDIVSFDPRGIGASVPRIECWASPKDRMIWDLQDVGVVDAHPGVLYDAFARAGAFSRLCEQNLEAMGILRHSSTTSHARDMLEILEKMGETKLRYWGFSYGTVLGGTFAAMYPDKVERMVNDGNVDYREWFDGSYINFLHDTDAVMDAFYDFCFQAGPLKCAFCAASPAAIRERLDALLAKILVTPVLIPPAANGPTIPELVTYSKVKRMISTALYQPIYRFRRVAEVFAALELGDGRPYYEYTAEPGPDPSAFCSTESVPPTIPISGSTEGTADAFPAIMCSDGQPFNSTVHEFEDYARRLQEMSNVAGSVQIVFRLSCVGRSVRPKWRFGGPFAGNTSFPILFVANIADNVTPLISATNNSAAFPGSVVLVQNSYGHTSLAAASTCTARFIRAYFQDGTMPAANTVCEPDAIPFEAAFLARDDLDALDNNGGSDGELTAAIRALSRVASWASNFQPRYF
ncbi:TAP-like protein-domain-containing protein [Cercophora scortea]|uniref:TAP-like protein-domain-containing protein n=1 Tax=Cercophora scortea TaxID=314031 RepID=A0AAE0MLX9_9PEZI|nr:TAP-like protein-domain-containing protein [Cercophora scortea]